MTSATPASPEDIRRGRRTLIGLAALFFLPLFAAFALYYGGGWHPGERTNHGQLFEPPVPLAVDWAQDKWTLVYVGNGRCDEACRDALLVMRQTRLGLAQEIPRVQRLLIATGECCDREFLDAYHEGMKIIDASAGTQSALVDAFPVEGREHNLFVVDPLGNLMMSFDSRENPKGLLTDLKKLLRLSHIG